MAAIRFIKEFEPRGASFTLPTESRTNVLANFRVYLNRHRQNNAGRVATNANAEPAF
jgi:hypothetical protein